MSETTDQEPKNNIEGPEETYEGDYPLRGSKHTGTVVSTDMEKSAVVRWEHSEKIDKYERFERRNTKVTAHVPESLEVEKGDEVILYETRPISKTKSHVIVEVTE